MNQPYSVLSHIYAIQDDTNIYSVMKIYAIQNDTNIRCYFQNPGFAQPNPVIPDVQIEVPFLCPILDHGCNRNSPVVCRFQVFETLGLGMENAKKNVQWQTKTCRKPKRLWHGFGPTILKGAFLQQNSLIAAGGSYWHELTHSDKEKLGFWFVNNDSNYPTLKGCSFAVFSQYSWLKGSTSTPSSLLQMFPTLRWERWKANLDSTASSLKS